MPESINSKLKEQYDHDDSGGSLDTNLGDFLDSEGASGTSNNSKWRDWASGTGTSLNTRLFHKHGGSGSFMTRWKNWIAFSSTHSFNFDGSNDYLDAGNGQSLGFSGADAFSISAWVYADVVNANQVILAFGSDTSSSPEGKRVAMFLASTAKPTLAFWGNDVVSAGTISAGQWVHLAMTFAGGNRTSANSKIYINGVSQTLSGGTASALDLSDMDFVHIGADQAIGQKFNGLIDEVAIWDAELSASDITSIYNNGKVIDLSKSASYGTDRTGNLKLWLRCGDKAEPESTTAIARQDFYTDFDGTDDYVSVADNDDLSFGSGSADLPLSISAWINPVDATNFTIVSKGVFNTDAEYIFQLDGNDKLYFALYDESVDNTFEGAYFNTALTSYQGSWFHVCATYNGVGGTSANAGIKLYIDGVEKSTVLTGGGTYVAMENLGGELEIGRIGSTYANGKISNLAIHQTELDAQTISQMAKSRFTPMRDNRFSAVSLDGTNDFIDCGNDSSLQFSGSFSIGCWFRTTDATATNEILISKADDGVSAGWLIRLNSSRKLDFSYVNSASGGVGVTISDTGSVVNDGQWYHVMFVHESGVGNRAYKNGVLVGSNSTGTDLGSHTPNFHIGNQDYTTARALACDVSSASAYNVAKSTEEVYAIYQQGITYDESSLSGLVGYWRMGDDTSKAYPTIADSSSNSNDGTITNGASDDIVQQMVAGYDLGAFESSSEELGGEFITSNTESDWTPYGSNDVTTTTNGVSVTNSDSDARGAYYQISGLTNGSLYKVVFNARSSNLDGNLKTYFNASATYFSPVISTTDTQYTIYGIAGSFNTLSIFALDPNNTIFIENFSVKKVLQSEVSDTYPAIIDVNEPVLGVEVNTVANATSPTNETNATTGWESGVYASTISSVAEAYTSSFSLKVVTSINSGFAQTSSAWTVDNDSTYKLSITWKTDGTNTNEWSYGWGVSQANASYGVEYEDGSTDWVTSVKYIKTTSTNLHLYLQENNSTSNALALYVDSISIKKVQGNVGTMTNQATSDLVYSSVLPDQSFLTGVNSAYNSFSFDGVDQFIISSSNINITGSSVFSMGCWFKPTSASLTGFVAIIAFSDVQGHEESTLCINSGKLGWNNQHADGDTYDTTTSLSADTWHYGLVTFNGSDTIKLYLNGSLIFTRDDVSNVALTADPFYIGKRETGNNFTGLISQAKVWNKELSATEISAIYTLGRHGNLLDSYSDNLLGYWAMSALDASTGLSDSISTIYDRSGNSNHGTPTNADAGDLASSPNAEPNGYAKGDTNRSTTTP